MVKQLNYVWLTAEIAVYQLQNTSSTLIASCVHGMRYSFSSCGVGKVLVKNNLCNGTRPDSLFATGAYTASDKHPVEKIVVWPRKTILCAGFIAR